MKSKIRLNEDRGSSRLNDLGYFLGKLSDNRLIKKYFIDMEQEIDKVWFSSITGSKKNKEDGVYHHKNGFHDNGDVNDITPQQHGKITGLAKSMFKEKLLNNKNVVVLLNPIVEKYKYYYKNAQTIIMNDTDGFISFTMDDIRENITKNTIRKMIETLRSNLDPKYFGRLLKDCVTSATEKVLNNKQ